VKNLCGKLDLRTIFAIVSLCDCVISMDSAIAHIASAFSRPLIVFFGPTIADFGFAPIGARIMEVSVPCRPCHLHGGNECKRQDRVCLASISEEQLLEELEKILK
jgi:heptosyltransferase-2